MPDAMVGLSNTAQSRRKRWRSGELNRGAVFGYGLSTTDVIFWLRETDAGRPPSG